MSIVLNIIEVCKFVLRNNVCLSFIIETWPQYSIAVSVIDIPGYSALCRDRSSDHHNGVCFFINAIIRYKRLEDLSCYADHEVLRVQLRPKRLPWGFSSLIVAVVYHPHWYAAKNEYSSRCNFSIYTSLIALFLWQETLICQRKKKYVCRCDTQTFAK